MLGRLRIFRGMALTEAFLRFLIGGLFVSAFSFVADIFRPKSFAGLFGAAPSIGLATLALTIARDGKDYAAVEAHSMIAGAIAFLLYACCASRLMMRHNVSALRATASLTLLWLVSALGLWLVWLRPGLHP